MRQSETTVIRLNFDERSNEWKMAKNMETAQGKGNYPAIKVDFDDLGDIIFIIQNPKDATFASNRPFIPKPGKQNPADFWDQFSVTGGGTDTLFVKDLNANKDGTHYAGGTYTYELRFTDKPALDPIITNGGCCKTSLQSNLVYYSVGAIAILALIVLVVRPMLRRR